MLQSGSTTENTGTPVEWLDAWLPGLATGATASVGSVATTTNTSAAPEFIAPRPLVAIVPARGGSKRIPGKNIRPFLGVPLLTRTIDTLRGANLFDRVVVSTDDPRIAEIAIQAGAEVPFRRDESLADDHTATAPVVADAVTRLESEMSVMLDPVCVVYPAAIFVLAEDLRAALDCLVRTEASLVFSATSFPAPIERAWRVDDAGRAQMIHPEYRLVRSQDLTTTYHDAGLFYWGTRRYWLAAGAGADQQGEPTRLHVLPRWRAVDIDTPEDWEHAELLYRLIVEKGEPRLRNNSSGETS